MRCGLAAVASATSFGVPVPDRRCKRGAREKRSVSAGEENVERRKAIAAVDASHR
jgi:hypothetical protein